MRILHMPPVTIFISRRDERPCSAYCFFRAMKVRYFRGFLLLLLATLSLEASAQWRVATPRDTVFVSAKKKVTTPSKMTLNIGVEAMVWVSGQYKMLAGNPAVFDGGYCTYFPGWNLPQPLRTSPPYTYNNVKYDFGLKYQTITGLQEYWFVPSELTYQSSHIYSTKITSAGNALQFFIKTPNDSYYANAQDGLTIRLARWTAGIVIKNTDVNFGNVLIGSSANYLDSIASYGIDPLKIDSVKIIGADASAFSFISQRNIPFTLPNELANEIKIVFTPQKRGNATAELFIYSSNTDAPSRVSKVRLNGNGQEPTLNVGNKSLDFGFVRVGYPKTLPTSIYNSGNANLVINQLNYKTFPPPDSVFGKSSLSGLPMITTPGSTGLLYTVCSPLDTISYNGFVYIVGNNNLKDTIACKCRGAKPIPEFSQKAINFGQVYSGDKVSRTVSLRNRGNWPISVVLAEIRSAASSVFSFTPSETSFIVEPDSIRNFTVTFNPGSRTALSIRGYFIFYYDDFTRDTVVLNGDEITPKMSITPKVYDFGKKKIGSKTTAVVTNMGNTGLIPLTFERQEVSSDRPFSIKNVPVVNISETVPLYGTFEPIAVGAASAWIFITSGGYKDSVLLLGVGAVAKGIFSPNILDFGIVKSNVVNTKTVTVTDSGTLALNVVRYEITGPDKADFRVAAIRTSLGTVIDTPFTIIEGATISFDIEFMTNAKTGAAHIATLCLYYDDSTSDCIPLQGIEEAQMVQFATSAVDFEKVRVKTHAQKNASFRNGSNITLSVGSTSIISQTDVFTVVGSLTPIAPSTTLGVPIDFYPTVRGVYSGFLRAQGGDIRTDSIQLRGIGAAPIPVVSDTVINFGKVAAGTIAQDSFFIVNKSDDSLKTDWLFRADSVFLRGDEYNEFSWRSAIHGDSNLTDTIAIGGLSDYTVYFEPSSVTIYHDAELVFLLDDKSEVIVRLIGLDESPNLVLGEDTLDFGKVRVGTPASRKDANLINTWSNTLIAGTLKLEPPVGVFASITPIGNDISVLPNLQDNEMPIELTFAPNAAGMFSARLISSDKDAITDTTFLVGEGAAPKAKFTPDTVLDFGEVLYSTSLTRTFELKNVGNWLFSTIDVKVVGTNAADFTANIANIINIEEDSLRTFSVTFLATTPIQTGDRTATIEFTLDDSVKVTYELLALDRGPYETDLRFDNVAIRIGDKVYPNLRLVTPIPDTLKINRLVGVITYDPLVADLLDATLAEGYLKSDGWSSAIITNKVIGTVTYDLNHQTKFLVLPTPILRLTFKAHEGVAPGAQTILAHQSFDYPGRKEVLAVLTSGVIVIDSTCGDTHLSATSPKASFIEQNRPNPFGISLSPTTDIPFTVGSDDTPVSLRILDMTGNEVLSLVRGTYARGRYSAKLDASQLPSGTYMYEYRAGSSKPQVKKLVVGK